MDFSKLTDEEILESSRQNPEATAYLLEKYKGRASQDSPMLIIILFKYN